MFGKHLNWETLYLHGFSMSTFCLPRSCLPHCGGFHTVPPHHHGSETSGCCLGTRDLLQPLGVVGSVAALVVKVGSKPSGKLLCFLMWLFKYRMFIHVYFYTYMYVYRLLCKLHLFIMLYTIQGEWTYVFVFFFFLHGVLGISPACQLAKFDDWRVHLIGFIFTWGSIRTYVE